MNIGSYTLLVARPGGSAGWWPRLGLGAAALAVLWWAARGSQVSFGELAKGLPWIGDFLGRMMPPNWAFLDKLIVPAIEKSLEKYPTSPAGDRSRSVQDP